MPGPHVVLTQLLPKESLVSSRELTGAYKVLQGESTTVGAGPSEEQDLWSQGTFFPDSDRRHEHHLC